MAENDTPFRVHHVTGTARDRGTAYAQTVGLQLKQFLDEMLYGDMQLRHGLDAAGIRAYAEACAPFVESETPQAWQFLQGMSEASGIDMVDLVALTAHEEYYHGEPLAHHCTGLAAAPSETIDRETYIGQTWDWMPAAKPYRHLLQQTTAAGTRILTYAYPGLWAAAGMSSAGIAIVWVGGGYDDARQHGGQARPGVPSYALIAEMLEQSSFDDALSCARNAHHAGWFIFLLASSGGRLARIEATPTEKAYLRPPGMMAANITYLDEQVRRSAHQEDAGPLPHYQPKHARMCELLLSHSGRLTPDLLMSFFRDHIPDPQSASICEHASTLDGFLFSPSRRKAWFIPGPPCQHEAEELAMDR